MKLFLALNELVASAFAVEIEISRGDSLAVPFPDPAHQTGRADFPHLGFRTEYLAQLPRFSESILISCGLAGAFSDYFASIA